MQIDQETIETAKYVLSGFRSNNARIATVESCTGGLIAATLTAIPGSSDVVDRGFVTYTDSAKTDLVGVPADLIRSHGAVSAEVAMAMAAGGLENSNATVCVSVTGIAGPDGGSEKKPVGLVFAAVAGPEGMFVEELHFPDRNRDQVRSETVQAALEMLVAFGLPDDEELPEEDSYGLASGNGKPDKKLN